MTFRKIIYAGLLFILILVVGCSRKTSPAANKTSGKETSNTTATKPPSPKTKKVKPPIARVIIMNDSVAKKTFDGRLYYDLDGRRYWKNYVDGKYYLYNKSQNSDPAFKKPS